jgi:hypothetical protein
MAGKGKNESATPRMNEVRAFVVEARMTDEGLSHFAQALSGFIRAATPAGRIAAPITAVIASSPVPPVEIESKGVNGVEAEEDDTEEATAASVRSERKARERKPVKREILKGVNLSEGEAPFDDFFKSKGSPTETSKRFMVIAAWFKLYSNESQVTVDHVYTAYRFISLNLDVKDIGQVFRDLKSQGWGDYKERKFEINDIGLRVVKAMTAEGANEPA